MIDEKIYTQEDLNNAVTKAINEMTNVLEQKEERINLLEQALNRAVDDMNELGIDPFIQIAQPMDKEQLMNALIDEHGWVNGWVQFYINEVTKNEKS